MKPIPSTMKLLSSKTIIIIRVGGIVIEISQFTGNLLKNKNLKNPPPL